MINEVILDMKFGDVTGDGIYDQVILVGNHLDNGKSPAVENLKILIIDGKTLFTHEIPIENIIGYQPTLSLFPFRNKQTNDISLSIASGGSGGFNYSYIWTYENNSFNKIFDSDLFDNMFMYQVNYLNNYKVEIINTTLNSKYILDISDRDTQYLEQLYYKDGTLKKETTGYVLGLNQAFPVDIDNNGIFELLTFQRVIGLYNADLLGYLETVLSWQEHKFEIFYNEQFLVQISS